MQRRSIKLDRDLKSSDDKCRDLENALRSEINSTAILKKQMRQSQLNADDSIWQLEEQLAHASNLIMQEREANADLREKLSQMDTKLVEVEMYLSSDKGNISLQLEQELASSKLRIAELEAEKDEMSLELRKRMNNKTKVIKDYNRNSKSVFAESSAETI